jgi:catechol 2,3-dioxygenase-like lactoylglutathione lyase family enzyme
MGILSKGAVIAMALLVAGCGPKPGELEKAQVAEARARQWLALIDAEDFGASWDAASTLFQVSIAKDEWEARARRTRLGLGDPAGRSLVVAKYTATYPLTQAPGEYVLAQYRTRFGGRPGLETLYMRRSSDGQWKADGYFVRLERPALPPGNPPLPAAPKGLVVGSGNFFGPVVADLGAAVAFYRDGLGFDVQGEPTSADSDPQLRAMFGLTDARIRRQVALAPPVSGGVEIIEIAAAGGRRAERNIDDPGAVMLSVIVADIEATLARLKELGAPVVTRGGSPTSVGPLRLVVVKDPAGHFVELLQTLKPQVPARSNVTGVRLRHTVHDLERSILLYRDALGLQGTGGFPGWDSLGGVLDALGLESTRQYRFALLTVPTSGLTLELIEFRDARRPAEPARIADPGSTLLELRVADIDAAVAAVTRAGGELVSAGGRPVEMAAGSDTAKAAVVRDPDGLFLVLTQRHP